MGKNDEFKISDFDMDGLMYDTEQIGMDCLINAAQKFGYVMIKNLD
ncbi:MAG: hypothetical protein ACLRQF_21980 [Thomasclavelia ramosa]